MMGDGRSSIRVPRELLEEAERYAIANGTSLTRLVSDFLRQLVAAREPLADTPLVRRLSGTLSREVSKEDYKAYLEQKYARDA
jgi:hypothetical protein